MFEVLFNKNALMEKGPRVSKISQNLTREQIFCLYGTALRYDISDNNIKVDIIKRIMGSSFKESAPGTNRVAMIKDGYIYKVALDSVGLKDNLTEFLRSPEQPKYLTKSYETNIVVLIQEYVNVMDINLFRNYGEEIKKILRILSSEYIFDDMGYIDKNYKNWGYRDNGDIVCLDYGYLWRLRGNEEALICPSCSTKLIYNSQYSQVMCTNPHCNTTIDVTTLRKRMNVNIELKEIDNYFKNLGLLTPDFNNLINEGNKTTRDSVSTKMIIDDSYFLYHPEVYTESIKISDELMKEKSFYKITITHIEDGKNNLILQGPGEEEIVIPNGIASIPHFNSKYYNTPDTIGISIPAEEVVDKKDFLKILNNKYNKPDPYDSIIEEINKANK